MIPLALSDENGQDSEPNIAVNPAHPRQIVATAFTRDPLGGPLAPVFVSNDGGLTWSLHMIVPGGPVTHDISVAFGTAGDTLYAGTLNGSTSNLNMLRTANPLSPSAMTVLDDRAEEDQPWLSAMTDETGARDSVYAGHNDFNTQPATASVELSQDARTDPSPAGFGTHVVEKRPTSGQDGPPVRTAVHAKGVVYAAFHRWVKVVAQSTTGLDLNVDVVVVRDDEGGGPDPFTALTDQADGEVGVRVAQNVFMRFTGSVGPLGQERIGADLAIAVNPEAAEDVWLAWCDRVGGPAGTDWTMHVRHSTDAGQTWSDDLHTVTNAKNPALAVNASGTLGLMYQQLVGRGAGTQWVTELALTDDAWKTSAGLFRLHIAPSSTPPRTFLPYIGDYLRLVSVGDAFFGVFSGSNVPDMAHFPSGVRYQRNANFVTNTLLGSDGATPVDASIDPFFVALT
jgi:hypothetical protein